jgi:hypothetical protein
MVRGRVLPCVRRLRVLHGEHFVCGVVLMPVGRKKVMRKRRRSEKIGEREDGHLYATACCIFQTPLCFVIAVDYVYVESLCTKRIGESYTIIIISIIIVMFIYYS